MNRTECDTTSPATVVDNFHYYHTPRSSRYDDHRLDRPPRSGDYSSLRSTLTSPPASKNHRTTRNSIYDGLTPSASSSSTTSSTSPFIYGTYSPKRHILTSHLVPSAALNSDGTIDNHHRHHLANNCYATLGHRAKPRAYDQRSISMLDSSSMPSSSMYGMSARRLTSAANPYAHLRSDYGNFNSRRVKINYQTLNFYIKSKFLQTVNIYLQIKPTHSSAVNSQCLITQTDVQAPLTHRNEFFESSYCRFIIIA